MPIDFPTSPATGQTYSYGINRWIYNGVAWDKLDNHPGISAGNQISVGYQESLSGATFSVNVIEGSGSDLDADLLDGVSGERFIENLQTGLLYGGLLSINSGNTATFNITSGSGIIVTPGGSTYSYPSPTVNYVSWSGASGLTLSGLTTYDITYISMNSSGNILQNHTPFTPSQYDSQIPIGALIHPTKSYISFAKSYPHVAYGQGNQMDGFVRAFGPLKLSGHEITGYPGTLQLSRSSGSAYNLGRNYPINPNSPNIVNDTDSNPTPTIYRQYRGATAGSWITVINSAVDATNYDDGSGTLNSVPGGKYTIQRVFYYPTEPTVLLVYYGRTTYNSIDTAKAALFFEEFSESDDSADSAIFCAYLIVKSGIPDFSSTGDYQIVQAGLFRSTANIGGGGVAVATLDDLSDVSITSVANNQALVYDSSSGDWVNKSFGDLPVVTSFNGLTGAVAGVNSIRGLTGAVGITNGSGIGLGVSGQTMTFSNTGVLSIDGGTGAITNVARTNVSNIFTADQLISAPFTKLSIVNTVLGVTSEYGASNITHYSGTNIQTISFNPTNPTNTITLPNVSTTLAGLAAGQTFTQINTFNARTNFPGGISAAGATFSSLARFNAGISAAGGTFSGTQTFINGATFTGNISAPNIVNSVRGLTGAVGITNESGIGLSVSGQTMTFSNTGVLSVNGSTGSVVTYAGTTGNIQFRYNNGVTANNYFTVESSSLGEIEVFTLSGATNLNWSYGDQEAIGLQIRRIYNALGLDQTGGVQIKLLGVGSDGGDLYGSNLRISTPSGTIGGSSIILDAGGGEPFFVLPNSLLSTKIHEFAAGINSYSSTSTNTFAGPIIAAGATFSSLARFNAGISAAGGTFGGNLRLQNGEFLQNTTNGRIDFMPAPSGSTHYGLYVDTTSWGFGPRLGTIRSSDNALNVAGILWDAALTVGTNVDFNLGSNQAYKFRATLPGNGNSTLQVGVANGLENYSGSLAIMDFAWMGNTAARAPGVSHANPNLYVYRAGASRANDFIRFEHDGNFGRIVSGGTSGISIEPGSGILGISGGVSGGYGLNANSFGLTSGFDIIPASWNSITAPMGAPGTVANRLYLAPISIPSRCTVKTFATQQGTSSAGNTGNIFLGLYNTNIHGLPQNLVAQSSSQSLTTTNFAVIRASNINYTANPGNYWLAICFSAGGLSGGIGRPGTPMKFITATSSSPIGQSMNWGLYVTQSGFTLSTSLSGATFTAITTNTDFPAIFYTAEGL